MFCRQCGAHLDDSFRFCHSCGAAATAVTATEAGSKARPAGQHGPSSLRIAFVLSGGVALVGASILAVLVYRLSHRAVPAAPESVAVPLSAVNQLTSVPIPTQLDSTGFRWSGLTPDEIRTARGALDAAITREEQAAGRSPRRDALGQSPAGALAMPASNNIPP